MTAELGAASRSVVGAPIVVTATTVLGSALPTHQQFYRTTATSRVRASEAAPPHAINLSRDHQR